MYNANPSLTKLYLTTSTKRDIFFTADQHLGHTNIIRYANRPFANRDEMDTYLIRRWNETVSPQDIVFHLSDFTLGKNAKDYFRLLNGHILFISTPWHHDRLWLLNELVPNVEWAVPTISGWVTLLPPSVSVTIVDNGKKHWFHLSHFPMQTWDRSHRGAYHLHGHSHGELPAALHRLDVGVDALGKQYDYAPVSFEQVMLAFREQDLWC